MQKRDRERERKIDKGVGEDGNKRRGGNEEKGKGAELQYKFIINNARYTVNTLTVTLKIPVTPCEER